jgi:hypothetical protein
MPIYRDMDNEIEPEQSEPQDTAVECQCSCQGECQCGKYRRPVYYEVDVNQYINSLNDWD